MTKQRTADAQPPARPAAGPRRRRSATGRPRSGAVAAIGIGLLLLVGAGQAVGTRSTESGGEDSRFALWSNPVPAYLASTGRAAVTSMRGLVPTEPPRVLGVADGAADAAPRFGGATSGSTGAPGAGRGTASTTGANVPDPVARSGANGKATTSAAAVAQAPSTPTSGVPIRVYFSRHPDSDATFTAVAPVKRTAPDRGVAAAALAELIDGPTTEERAAGYYSELGGSLRGPSTCDGRDFRLAIREGVATVRFCRSVTSAGIGQDARVRAQIEATLTQFSTIRSVRLLGSDGHCLYDESGLDRCLAGTSATSQPSRATGSR